MLLRCWEPDATSDNISAEGLVLNPVPQLQRVLAIGEEAKKEMQKYVYFSQGVVLKEDLFVEHILGYLDKRDLLDGVSFVCKSWFRACQSPNVLRWQTIDLSGAVFGPSPDHLLQLVRQPRFAKLEVLRLPVAVVGRLSGLQRGQPYFTDSVWSREISDACPHLKGISWLPANCISECLPHFPSLKELSIVFLKHENCRQFVESILETGHRLEILNLWIGCNYDGNNLSEDDFLAIANACPNLQAFSCMKYGDGPRKFCPTGVVVKGFIQGCPELWNLDFRHGQDRETRRVNHPTLENLLQELDSFSIDKWAHVEEIEWSNSTEGKPFASYTVIVPDGEADEEN